MTIPVATWIALTVAMFCVGGGVGGALEGRAARLAKRDPWYVIGVVAGGSSSGSSRLTAGAYGPFHSRRAAAAFRRRYAKRWECALSVTRGDFDA